jgi:hypothetical protein
MGPSTHSRTHARMHAHTPPALRRRPPSGVQRLEVLVAVMLARERRILADAEAGGCTALAAALATLPSGVIEIVANAVAALGAQLAAGDRSDLAKVQRLFGPAPKRERLPMKITAPDGRVSPR